MTDGPSDDALLLAWRGGDTRAGAVLVVRYSDDLLRFFQGKVDSGVEDLVQETLAGCVAATRDDQQVKSFRAYLFGIARHRLLDELRKRRRVVIDPMEQSLADLGTSPSARAARNDDRRVVQEALRSVPLDLQIVLELYYWEGVCASDLAGILAIPEGTVRSRIRRGKRLVRERIEQLAPDELGPGRAFALLGANPNEIG